VAFPVVQSSVSGSSSTAATTHDISFPSGLAVGDRLLILLGVANGDSSTLSGWTLVHQIENMSETIRGDIFTKIADSTDVSNGDVTVDIGSSAHAAWIVYRITSTSDVAGFSDFGNSSTPDPPSESSLGDTLWISWASWEGAGTHSSYSSGYSSNQVLRTGIDVHIAASTKNLNASSDDPGAHSLSGTTNWVAGTIAIGPVPAGGSGVVSGTGVLVGEGDSPPVPPAEGSGVVSGTGVIVGEGDAPAVDPSEGSGVVSGTGSLAGEGDAPAVGPNEGSGTVTVTGSVVAFGETTRSGSGAVAGTGTLVGEGDAPGGPNEGSGVVSGTGESVGTGFVATGGNGSVTSEGIVIGAGPSQRNGSGGKHMKCCCGNEFCHGCCFPFTELNQPLSLTFEMSAPNCLTFDGFTGTFFPEEGTNEIGEECGNCLCYLTDPENPLPGLGGTAYEVLDDECSPTPCSRSLNFWLMCDRQTEVVDDGNAATDPCCQDIRLLVGFDYAADVAGPRPRPANICRDFIESDGLIIQNLIELFPISCECEDEDTEFILVYDLSELEFLCLTEFEGGPCDGFPDCCVPNACDFDGATLTVTL